VLRVQGKADGRNCADGAEAQAEKKVCGRDLVYTIVLVYQGEMQTQIPERDNDGKERQCK
jgi:hypothetical protein